MKATIISGSPHQNGTTAALTKEFIRGAEEAGHEVYHFDGAEKEVHPCKACYYCKKGKGCVYKDGMEELNPHLIEAEVVVFVTPVYYYAMSAQIKTVIDRFFANNVNLHKGKKSMLLMAMSDKGNDSAKGAITSFEIMNHYMEWESGPILAAADCYSPEDLKNTDYLEQAYQMGKNL